MLLLLLLLLLLVVCPRVRQWSGRLGRRRCLWALLVVGLLVGARHNVVVAVVLAVRWAEVGEYLLLWLCIGKAVAALAARCPQDLFVVARP